MTIFPNARIRSFPRHRFADRYCEFPGTFSGSRMRRIRLPAGLLLAGLVLLQCGCPGNSNPHTYPNDPLFVSKKPLEVTPSTATQKGATIPSEPLVPPVPAVVRLAAKQ